MPTAGFDLGPYLPMIALAGGVYLIMKKKKWTYKVLGAGLLAYWAYSTGMAHQLAPQVFKMPGA